MAAHQALELLCGNYVFPDKAKEAADVIRSRQEAGSYTGLSEQELSEKLTAELFELCSDKHLRVRVRAPELQEVGTTKEAEEAAWREYMRTTNYRISRAERLDGNVGYLDLRGVPSPGEGGRAIAAAMELVSHTEALIIDLRKNWGGDPDGVIFWCSYTSPNGHRPPHGRAVVGAELRFSSPTRRPISTASSRRRPARRSSIGAWRRSEPS